VRVFPEWFGAARNGQADDATAVQAAFNGAAASGAAMLYLSSGSYGIGRELTFTNQANIMSEDNARFVSGKAAPWASNLDVIMAALCPTAHVHLLTVLLLFFCWPADVAAAHTCCHMQWAATRAA
jgi:hypothetical protein